MAMKLTEFDGQPAIFVSWLMKKPKAGDHMNIYEGEDGAPARQVAKRLIFVKQLHSEISKYDANMTEEWWSFREVSESDFGRMRQASAAAEAIRKTHESLF